MFVTYINLGLNLLIYIEAHPPISPRTKAKKNLNLSLKYVFLKMSWTRNHIPYDYLSSYINDIITEDVNTELFMWIENNTLIIIYVYDKRPICAFTQNVSRYILPLVVKDNLSNPNCRKTIMKSLPGTVTIFARSSVLKALFKTKGLTNVNFVRLKDNSTSPTTSWNSAKTKFWLINRIQTKSVPQIFFNDELYEDTLDADCLDCIIVHALWKPLKWTSQLRGF